MSLTQRFELQNPGDQSLDHMVLEHPAKAEVDMLIKDLIIAHKATLQITLKDDWTKFNEVLYTGMFNKIS
mgnify:CR=1 FL=1|tara:strand:- start:3875 stop:4084 length:210 start_codon:yes stop_codon:yes gene_type:complete